MVERAIKGQGYKSGHPNMERRDRGRSESGGPDNGGDLNISMAWRELVAAFGGRINPAEPNRLRYFIPGWIPRTEQDIRCLYLNEI